MAFEFIEAVYRLPDVTSTDVLILGYLANRANEKGECWPTRRLIAAAVRMHPDTIKAALQSLDARGLIRKEARFEDGRRVANRLVMGFAPYLPGEAKRGKTPPGRGGEEPRSPGGVNSGPKDRADGDRQPHEEGGATTPEKNPQSKSPKNPQTPKGAVSVEVRALTDELWSEAPAGCRQRSGKDDVARALDAALDRGGKPDEIRAALRAYWTDVGGRDDGRWLKGLHRMIQQDRWREWAPEGEDEDGGSDDRRPVKRRMEPEEHAAYLLKVWRGRLADYRRICMWKPMYGPEPGKPGCQVPAEILAEEAAEAQQ